MDSLFLKNSEVTPPKLNIDIKTGLLTGPRIFTLLSPNRDERPADMPIELLVVHNISLPPNVFYGDSVIKFFMNQLDITEHPYFEQLAGVRVSSHLFIRRDGQIIQFVPFHERAWHAGRSEWRGRTACNDFSIGIELEGTDTYPYTNRQYARLASVTHLLKKTYPITDYKGHSDIAPVRKTDPGESFDWIRFQRLVAGNRKAGK